jgi:hypothetical protein
MFLSRKTYEDLRDDLRRAQARATAVDTANVQLRTHLEWLQVRLTQLEYERAQLLKKYMNLDIPTPSFEPPSDTPDPNQTMDFNDMGDDAASALGITYNPDGTLNFDGYFKRQRNTIGS